MKRFILIILTVIASLISAAALLFLIGFKKIQGPISFRYPRSWDIEIGKQATTISPRVISQNDYTKPQGMIIFSSAPVADRFESATYQDKQYANAHEIIDGMIQEEEDSVALGNLPVIPGPGSFEYIGVAPSTLPVGYEEIANLSTLSASEAHVYWQVNGKTLNEIFVEYPLDPQARASFTRFLYLILRTVRAPSGL